MPCFRPTLAEAYQAFPRFLLDVAQARESLDEAQLSYAASSLLSAVRRFMAMGICEVDILAALTIEAPNPDERLRSALRAHFNEMDLSKARVLCVTTEYDNDAMWANYANGHSGFVFGFRHLAERSTALLAATQVEYFADVPSVGSGLDFLLYGDSAEIRSRTLQAICFTKKAAWAYEREWRVLTWRWDEEAQYGDYSFLAEELESITFGPKSDPFMKHAVIAAVEAKYPRCNVFQLKVECGDSIRLPIRQVHADT